MHSVDQLGRSPIILTPATAWRGQPQLRRFSFSSFFSPSIIVLLFALSCILQLVFLHFSRSFAPSGHSPLLFSSFSLSLSLSLSLPQSGVLLPQDFLPFPPFLTSAFLHILFLFLIFLFIFYLASLAYLDLRHLFSSRLPLSLFFLSFFFFPARSQPPITSVYINHTSLSLSRPFSLPPFLHLRQLVSACSLSGSTILFSLLLLLLDLRLHQSVPSIDFFRA